MSTRTLQGRQALEEVLGLCPSPSASILQERQPTDASLMKIASELSPEDPHRAYQRMGGQYTGGVATKVAANTGGIRPDVQLFAHQKEAVQKVLDKDGNLLLSHPVGSGKTLTAIAAFEGLKKAGKAERALVVAPASLRTNFVENGVKKFTTSRAAIFGNAQEVGAGTHVSADSPDHKADYHVVSYELFRADPHKYIKASGADTIIYDEMHRAKNEGVLTSQAIKDARPLHRNFIGMTGSIVSNTPADIVPLVEAMTNGQHSLGNKTSFESRFVQHHDDGSKTLKNPQVLRAMLNPYVHHVDAQTLNTKAPTKKIETVLVNMNERQNQLYRLLTDQLDPLTKLKMQAGASKLNNTELNNIFSKLVRLRQLSNSIHTVDLKVSPSESARLTPKVRTLLNDVEEHIRETPDAQVVIHTNLIQGGVDVLTAGLRDRKIDHALFIGKGNAGVTEKTRQHGVAEFQQGKKKVIVLSAAGGEGLDLPNTTFMAMLDGHFNPEKINQAEARGVRAGGQAHRAEPNRQVLVRRYMSVVPADTGRKVEVLTNIWNNINPTSIMKRIDAGGPAFFNPFAKSKTVDEWTYGVAKQKANLNHDVHGLLKSASVYTHEDFEDTYVSELEKVAIEHFPVIPLAVGGAVLGGMYGALMGGTPPRKKQEVQQDPNAPVRNRIGSIVGSTVGGALGGAHIGLMGAQLLQANPMMPILHVTSGQSAGVNIADLLAPKRKVPVSVQAVLGENQQDYSDRALFGKYWDRFGDEITQKGMHAEVQDRAEEHKYVNALRELYTQAVDEKHAPQTIQSGGRKGENHRMSKREFWLQRVVPAAGLTTAIGGLNAILPQVIPASHPSALLHGVVGAAPLAMSLGTSLAKQYRDTFSDPGMVSSASKGDTKKRAKFTDEQLQKLLRGVNVDEVKTKSHYIK